MEIWKNIEGYKPIYQVSNLGQVRSIERETNDNGGKYKRKTKLLRQTTTKNGYKNIYLYDKDGKKRTILVHKIVALAFIGKPAPNEEIDHIDGNRGNNACENLRWVTHKVNCGNPMTKEKHANLKGEKAPYKKSIIAYDLSGKKVGEWPTITMAAEETGTCRNSISFAAKGKYKFANNLIWKYNG